MAKSNPEPAGAPGTQSIEHLQKRYGELHRKQIEAARDLDNAEKRLEELKREAREKFKTDDVGALQRMLAQMRDENEAKRAKYQNDLDHIEKELATVEQKFAAQEKTADAAPEQS
jgi:hypothetical protein